MKSIYLLLAAATFVASCSNTASESELQTRQFTIDSLKAAAVVKEDEAQKETAKHNAAYLPVKTKTITTTTQTTQTATAVTPAKKKKGWSNVAKGAVIGGVVGAGTGIAVSKDKVKGGVIGGVVGAGVGAGVGAILDKKKNQ